MKVSDFAYSVTTFLTSFLTGQQNASSNTILAYRDTFKLLLRFSEEQKHLKVEALQLSKVDKHFIEDFLLWLEIAQKSSISTRNQRLAGIRSFFRYLQAERPDLMLQCQQILSIPVKKMTKQYINYLSIDAIKLVFSLPDASTNYGLRDLIMLCLLYDSGARVSELIEIKVMDLRLEAPSVVTLHGKGRKVRQCPLSEELADKLKVYLSSWKLDLQERSNEFIFVGHKGEKLTRAGVAYILKKYVEKARQTTKVQLADIVTPHVMRHSKAMHLLQAGVNLVYIRDILGHSSIKTTEIYARADSEMKRAAIEKASVSMIPNGKKADWTADTNLMSWLMGLGK